MTKPTHTHDSEATMQQVNPYEARQQAKRERLEDLAAAADREGQRIVQGAHRLASVIPFGQPVLVGHHSEGRDRRYRARIHNTFARGFAAMKKADYYRNRAESVGCGGISSDDPEAITKLQAQLAAAEAEQQKMKAANACIRSGNRTKLASMGYTPEAIDDLLKPDFAGRVGYPAYRLSNNNANIRRIKQRIAELEQKRQRKAVELVTPLYTYREDADDNRVMFLFDGKPSDQVREILKRHAFKWSPGRPGKPWVRQLTGNALYAASCVRDALDKLP